MIVLVVELVKVNAQQALSAKVMESTLSMQIHAWIAVLVQAFAQQVLSARNNSLIRTDHLKGDTSWCLFLLLYIREETIDLYSICYRLIYGFLFLSTIYTKIFTLLLRYWKLLFYTSQKTFSLFLHKFHFHHHFYLHK